MDSAELRVMRKQTAHFIQENPTTVTLTRTDRQSDGAGGYTTKPGAPVQPQTFRLIPQDVNNDPASSNVDSTELVPRYIMIGAWDADVRDDDRFTLNGRDYEVAYVRNRDANAYETWAQVIYRG